MSSLQEMLNLNVVDDITTNVEITNRILDKDGRSFKFTIKPISFSDLNELKKRATYFDSKGKAILNEDFLNTLIVIENTLEPNFKDSKSIAQLNCTTPEQYLNKVLLAGEIEKLIKAILTISGFDSELDEMVDDIKN